MSLRSIQMTTRGLFSVQLARRRRRLKRESFERVKLISERGQFFANPLPKQTTKTSTSFFFLFSHRVSPRFFGPPVPRMALLCGRQRPPVLLGAPARRRHYRSEAVKPSTSSTSSSSTDRLVRSPRRLLLLPSPLFSPLLLHRQRQFQHYRASSLVTLAAGNNNESLQRQQQNPRPTFPTLSLSLPKTTKRPHSRRRRGSRSLSATRASRRRSAAGTLQLILKDQHRKSLAASAGKSLNPFL